jgi:hypothetical protein
MEEYYRFINECRLKDYSNIEVQVHHILPKHMGGDNINDNLIKLSIEDHYIAHILLSECFEKGSPLKRSNLASAIFIKKSIDNREVLLEYRESLKGEGNPNYGNNWTVEQKKEQSKKVTIKMKNLETLEKMRKPKSDTSKMGKYDKSGENNPFYGKTHSEDTRKILSKSRIGKKPSNTRKILIEGNIYDGLTEASIGTGIKGTTIWHRIHSKNKKYENYKYID